MNKKSTVGELMTKNVVVGNPLNTLTQMLEFFRTYKVQHLPVCEGDKLIGIISLHDLMDYMAGQILDNGSELNCNSMKYNFNIRAIMTEAPITVSSTDNVAVALNILGKASFQSLPVVDDGRLVGILTNKDLVKHLSKNVEPQKAAGLHLNFNSFL